MAGRVKYTQEQRDTALAALMASAVEGDGGVWKPQFRVVGRQQKLGDRTLRRWWKERDVSQDDALRRANTRARSEVRKDGAKDWLESQVSRVQNVVTYITDPQHYSRELVEVPFSDGKLVRLEGTRPDHAARAMKLTVEVLKDLDGLMAHQSASTPDRKLASLKEAARKVGIIK